MKWWGRPCTRLKPGPYQLLIHQRRPVDLRVDLLHHQVVDLLVFPTEAGHALLQLTDAGQGEWPTWLVGPVGRPTTHAPSPRRGLPPQTLAWGFLLRGLEGRGPGPWVPDHHYILPHPSFPCQCFPGAYSMSRTIEGSGRKRQVHCSPEPTVEQEPQG